MEVALCHKILSFPNRGIRTPRLTVVCLKACLLRLHDEHPFSKGTSRASNGGTAAKPQPKTKPARTNASCDIGDTITPASIPGRKPRA